ncbi:MAG: ABC transporter permease [Rhodospirillales bacterium]|nr:ABC transporter permease [Rhodospirillales bacterium]
MDRERLIVYGMPVATVVGLFVLWEAVCAAFDVPVFILPRPSVVLETLVRLWGPIWQNAWFTLRMTLAGFALAVVVGLFTGVAIGASRVVYAGLYPVLIGFNSVPKVAVVPVLVVWFGIGAVPAILTAFMIAFLPIAVNVATGLATIEPEMRDVLRSLGARKLQILWKVGIPRSLPYFFASLKVAITLAFVGSVVAETVASNEGIGALMLAASARFDVPLVFAGLIVIALMGVVMYGITVAMESRFTGWATRGQH